jgi:hypothetical protein
MKIKIILDKNETKEDADAALLKALDLHRDGEVHLDASFEDAAMVDTEQRLRDTHDKIYQEMLEEINEALEDQYSGY